MSEVKINLNDENIVTIELDADGLNIISEKLFKDTDLEGNLTCNDVGYLIQGFMSTLVNFDQELPYGNTAFDKGVLIGEKGQIKSITRSPEDQALIIERRAILDKPNRKEEDETRLKELDELISKMPVLNPENQKLLDEIKKAWEVIAQEGVLLEKTEQNRESRVIACIDKIINILPFMDDVYTDTPALKKAYTKLQKAIDGHELSRVFNQPMSEEERENRELIHRIIEKYRNDPNSKKIYLSEQK